MPPPGPVNEHKPPLKKGDLTNPENIEIDFDIDPTGNYLTFTMQHSGQVHINRCNGPSGCIAIGRDVGGDGYYLIVPPGQDRIFTVRLSGRWHWSFEQDGSPDNLPMSVKKGSPAQYGVDYISPDTIEIYAKSRGQGSAHKREAFNFYLLLDQVGAKPIPIRIDPVTDNPPSGGGGMVVSGNGPVPAGWRNDI